MSSDNGGSERSVEPGGPVRTVETGEVDEERFLAALRAAVDILERAGIRHVIMGGLAVASLARPRWTHDIDIFLRPDDASRALELFASEGYETEETDPLWLFKAEKGGVLVDLIFRSTGYYYFDEDIWARSIEVDFKGERIRVISPEDLLVIKASAHTEDGGYHWFDALALLGRRDLDWSYLKHRGRRAVRRLLSLLIYADSYDVAIPAGVIDDLYATVYAGRDSTVASPGLDAGRDDEAGLERLLADPRIADLDVDVSMHGDTVLITGEVRTTQRRQLLEEVAGEIFPGRRVDNRLKVVDLAGTPRTEEIA